MGSVCHYICTTFSVLLAVGVSFADDQLFMVRSPEPIAVPIGDDFTLECEMNIKPDGFRWRHFPISSPTSNVPLNLDKVVPNELPRSSYTFTGKQTVVTVNVNSTDVAGDYQCLATYGSAVLASIPGRVTIAKIGRFPAPRNSRLIVAAGNTVAIRCDLPPSNPPASVQYYKSNTPVSQSLVLSTGTLLLTNVSNADSGTYTCNASNYITGDVVSSRQETFLTVSSTGLTREEPKFLSVPQSNYTVKAGENVFMECSAVGYPPPKVVWYKLSGQISPDRGVFHPGGFEIKNVTKSDEGIYVCKHGNLTFRISLLFYERPTVRATSLPPNKEGENVEFECNVTGTPEPVISWLINGESALNDNNTEVIGNKIYFCPIEKKHAGLLQCLVSNVVGSDFGYTFLNIIPKQITTVNPTSPRIERKNPVMIPPSKPNVTRLSDESVMVRWSVPKNSGLPIQFFKVQYREFGAASQTNGGRPKSSGWKTTNADIIPYVRSYAVDNLKPDHIYRFRIAAVYSNNDHKLGPNSAKFHLKREEFHAKNSLPAPRLVRAEALSLYSIKIYWEYTPNPNITIDGFYVNYQPASTAGDYYKATADGESTRTYVINHLQPDTSYDIKLQSYTMSGVSEFSSVLQQKTLRPKEETTSISPPTPHPMEETSGPPQLYVIIGGVIIGVALILGGILAFIIFKKKKEKDKDLNPSDGNDCGDKMGGGNEDRRHHIQVDANGYIAKAIPRGLSNGCGPQPNRMTITANPLADSDDNQNQNMIEMSCLSSQNNNCAAVEASASNESAQPSMMDSIKTRGKVKTDPPVGENYV